MVFLIAGLSNGCSWIQKTTKGFTDMTPKEKSTFFMGVYNKNFDETMAIAQKPTLTEDEKKMVRVKKEILTHMYSAMAAYNLLAVDNPLITDNVAAAIVREAEIRKLIDELLGLVDRLVAATIPSAGVK